MEHCPIKMYKGKFKLITGLGSKDKNKVKDLVLVWMKAGADIFDTSIDVMPYIQSEAIKAGFDLNKYTFCVSIPVKGDIHGKKAKIIKEKCTLCNQCKNVCIDCAINPPEIDKLRCIGCSRCQKVCGYNAIEIYDDEIEFDEFLKKDVKLDMVEVHISIKDIEKIKNDYKKIIDKLKNINCIMSVCLNRNYFSNETVKELLFELKEITKDKPFIVQADGNSMNGGSEDLSSTIETIAFGNFVKNLGYDVVLSGGTNEYSAKLANEINLDCSIGYGSFARKMTEAKEEKEALRIASDFVKRTKSLLNAKQC